MSAPIPTTEQLLTTPLGFDLHTATNVQRARCRIGDGIPLGALDADPDVLALVGGPEALAALPSEQGVAPDIDLDAASIRSCKTMVACCRAARAVYVVDTSVMRIGEVARIPLFSLKLSRSRVAFRMLDALFSRPALAPLVISRTAEALTVRSPSGVPIEIVCVAGGRAAADFVGDWLAGFVADEAPRMLGRDEGVTNLADTLTAVQGRMLPGAQIHLIGSPWAPHGPFFDRVTEHFGKPSKSVVVLRSTGPMNNPAHFTPEMCEELERTDPVAYATSVQGEFADPETGLLSFSGVKACTPETRPLEIQPSGADYTAGVDTSGGGAKANAQTLVVTQHIDPPKDGSSPLKYRVVLAREWRGLGPEAFWKEVAGICHSYGLKHVYGDAYAGSHSVDIARHFGLSVIAKQHTHAELVEYATNLATAVATSAIEFPPDRQFRKDILSIKKRTTQSGYQIHVPVTSDGRHCDFYPALCESLFHPASHVETREERYERKRNAHHLSMVLGGGDPPMGFGGGDWPDTPPPPLIHGAWRENVPVPESSYRGRLR